MSSHPIDQPGTIYSACGKWGCGSHGDCGANNTCTCFHGWSGSSCETPPQSAPNPNVGDMECGNWGVFGSLVLNSPGYAATCDCTQTNMTGDRCEVECEANEDCGVSGVCDTAVGRCQCTQDCFIDSQCDLGTCEGGKCTNGWTDVKCTRALSDECNTDSDCGHEEGHGSCVNSQCQCNLGFIGKRCEQELAGTGEACTYSSDCRDALVNDVCVDNVCEQLGNECNNHSDCRVICRDNLCTFPLIPPEITEQELSDMIGAMVEEMLTAEGIAQFLAEEGIEEAIGKMQPALLFAFKKVKAFDKLFTHVVKRGIARRSATVSFAGAAPVVTRGVVTTAIKNLSNQAVRAGVKAAAKKLTAGLASTPFAVLFFTLQAVGMVLDIDDSAGFNAQVPQDGVNMYMKKMLSTINEFPDLVDAGVQFPREYLPEDTIEYRSMLYGDVSNDRRTDLMLDYVDHLDVNSNGNTIIREWTRPASTLSAPEPKNSILWSLAGKNQKVYTALTKWWWLILVLVVVIAVTLGLGLGLTARKRRNRQ